MLNGTRNIFLNKDYELISFQKEPINKSYTCYDGDCYEIECDNDRYEYYLNTEQTGKIINAMMRCKKMNGVNVYEMVDCDQNINYNIYYENAAAREANEAIILCTSKSCTVEPTNLVGGLPLCKLGGNDKIDKTT